MTTTTWFLFYFCISVAFLLGGWVGRSYQALRHPLGKGALQKEIEDQRSRAERAEALLDTVKRAAHGIKL